MLKKLSLTLLLILCMAFTACSDNKNDTGKEEPGNTTAPEQNQEEPKENGDLNVFFFELGKADAFLIYNNKTTILIDTGEKGDGKDILQYMENNNIKDIDYMFITHFDKDHVGGANKVLGNVHVGQIYTNGNSFAGSEDYQAYKDRVSEKAVPETALKENLSFEVNGIKIDVNVPAREMYDEDLSNNSSLIIRITYGENKFVFMGDALDERIREYLATKPETCDVLKMPHHGSYMVTLSEMITTLKPKYAVITSSKEEKEADSTKELLEKLNVKLYRTRKGSTLMRSDGKKIDIFQVS